MSREKEGLYKKKRGSRKVNHHTLSDPVGSRPLAVPVWTGGAGGGVVKLVGALVVNVYWMVEPAAVGRVADEVASDEDVTDSDIDNSVEEDSAAVDDRVEVTYCDVVSVRGDDTLDRVSVGTDDVAALVDGVAVTDGEDDCSVAALEDGIPTTVVDVTEDKTEEAAEVPREDVGNGFEEAEGGLVA